MNVIVAKSAGFCWGVRRAVDTARTLASRGRPIHTDGPLIHNRQMIDSLQAEGILECGEPGSLSDTTLLIRAHGIPPDRRAMLQSLPVSLADATCPDVARTQGLIKKHVREGYQILIFGDAGHAEVTGLLGYAVGNGYVVGSVSDVESLPDIARVCLVAQSTQFTHAYKAIAQAAESRFPDTKVLDTICASTKNRQGELREIAENADAVVVVGGAHSANTMRLLQLARELRPSFHIQTAEELDADQFRNFDTVALTAGASTPDSIIEDVRKCLEEM